MPETRHADEGFHEIQLSGKQLVFLFMATTVVAVVIFLCGVLVGRGVQAERAPAGDASVTSAAVLPPVGGDAAPSPGPAASGAEDLSYHRRLQGDASSAAATAATADDQLKARQAEPPAPAEAAPPEPASGGTAAPRAAAAAARDAPGAAGWVVQIAAMRDRTAADAIARRLAGKGYPAFLVPPAPGAPAPGYRVRVGRYTDRREAERIARRLEREEQFRPFITR